MKMIEFPLFGKLGNFSPLDNEKLIRKSIHVKKDRLALSGNKIIDTHPEIYLRRFQIMLAYKLACNDGNLTYTHYNLNTESN